MASEILSQTHCLSGAAVAATGAMPALSSSSLRSASVAASTQVSTNANLPEGKVLALGFELS